ncbi:carbohydrate ABC transporter permease [Streptomyces sp. NPDC088747]|uniref:carbohydrate ABC transporter permease n=1 Tax=Streptomyces sp. NPDC088747 TaxID=3365886 RepID=UPI0037F8F814
MSTHTNTERPVRRTPAPAGDPGSRSRTGPPVTPASTGRRPRGSWTSKAVVNGLLVLFSCYTLMPLTWLLVAATKDRGDLVGTGGFTFADFNLFTNLGDLFSYGDGIYVRWLVNSVLYFGLGCLASAFVSTAVGYAFDKYDFPHKEKLFGLVLLGVLVPGAVLVLPQYLLASKAGLDNTYWAVLVPLLVNPFGVYLARVFSESYIPDEVVEAARMDGAGEWRVFRSVGLPMIAPGFVTLFLFTFTSSWNNFVLPLYMLSDEKLYPVTLGLAIWSKSSQQNPEFYMLTIVGALISVLPLIVAFVCLQRFWRSGLTAGAVK